MLYERLGDLSLIERGGYEASASNLSDKPVYRPLEPEHIGKQMPTYLILALGFARNAEVLASLFELRIFGLGLL